MHGLVTLFFEVITLVIILLVAGLAVPCVLVVASTTIMALIVSMTIIWSAIIAVASVASMTVAVVATAMLAVARLTATCSRKMSHFLFLRLLLILGDLIKNTSRLAGCLILLKEGNHSEQVGRYHLV